jgi:tRNA pseudouridine55 synthase
VLSGFVFFDKPAGWTSFDLIRYLRRVSGIKKIGHTGTLDPFATGLVVLCVNNTTRLSSFLMGKEKEYFAKVVLDCHSNTGDSEGVITPGDNTVAISDSLINHAAEKMLSVTEQVPPQYSAVKIAGKPAYVYARKGQLTNINARPIKVYDFSVCESDIDNDGERSILYRAKVSKGTYIRVLSETFARFLGTVGYTKELRRTRIGRISVEDAVDPDSVTPENWQQFLKPVQDVFIDEPKIFIDKGESLVFMSGGAVTLKNLSMETTAEDVFVYSEQDQPSNIIGDAEAVRSFNQEIRFLGIGRLANNILKPNKVMA